MSTSITCSLRPRASSLQSTLRQTSRGLGATQPATAATPKNSVELAKIMDSKSCSRRGITTVSERLQHISNVLSVGSVGVLLFDLPVWAVKRATAAVADAVLGPSTPRSVRLLLRRALRTAVALAALTAFTLRVHGALDLLARLDLNHHTFESLADDVGAEVELVSAVDSLLGPLLCPALPLRATVALASIVVFLIKLRTTSDALSHLDFEHGLLAGALSVLDLVTSGPSLLENCRELMQVGAAVGRVSRRWQSTSSSGDVSAKGSLGEVKEAP